MVNRDSNYEPGVSTKEIEYAPGYELGFRFLGCGSDSVFFSKGALNLVARGHHQRRQSARYSIKMKVKQNIK